MGSCNANRDAVHRIGAITLRIPTARDMRLHDAAGIGRSRPDLVIALARQLYRRGPALPVVGIFWCAKLGTLPRRAEVDRNVDALYRVMRLLAASGIFVEQPERRFKNNPSSEILRSDASDSLRHYARWIGSGFHWKMVTGWTTR